MKRTLFLTAAVPLLLLVGGGLASATPPPPGDPEERIRQFVQCMREQGVDLPDPTEADGPVHIEIGPDEREAFESAHEACDEFAPRPGKRVELDPALREQVEEFHECLSEHGVDLPEPAGAISLSLAGDARPVPPGAPAPTEVRVAVPPPGAEEAVEACRHLLPEPPADAGPVVVGEVGDVVVGVPAVGVGVAVDGA